MQSRLLLIIFAMFAGVMLPLQAAINTRLSKTVGNPIVAAFISFAVGTIALFIYLLLSRSVNIKEMAFRQTPWWVWIGGFLGALYIIAIIMLLPRLGVALAFSLVIAGQMATAIIFDHYGWLGVGLREISVGKIAGALLIIAGVVLIRKF